MPVWASVSENKVCRKGPVVLVMSLGMCYWTPHCGEIQLDQPFTVADYLLQNHLQTSWPFSFVAIPSCCYLLFYLAWACLEPVVSTAGRDQHSFLDICLLMPILVLPSWQAWQHALLECGTTKYFPHWFTGSRIDVTQVFQPLKHWKSCILPL